MGGAKSLLIEIFFYKFLKTLLLVFLEKAKKIFLFHVMSIWLQLLTILSHSTAMSLNGAA